MNPSKSLLAIVAASALAAFGGLQAAPLFVVNYSFEDDVAPVGGVNQFVPTGWSSFGQIGGSDIGSQNPTNGQFSPNNPFPFPAQGNQFAYVNVFPENPNPSSGIFQDLGALQPNTIYTLTVAIGSRADRINSPGIISLYSGFDPVGGTLLATGGGIPAIQNTWEDYTISFTTGSIVSDNLIISLSVLPAGTIQAAFDNVRLDATAVPEPSTVAMLALGGLAAVGLVRRRTRK